MSSDAKAPFRRIAVEAEFDRCVTGIGGIRVGELLGDSPNFSAADYLCGDDAQDRSLVMIGDFNCDPASDTAPGSVVINGLRRFGYGFINPEGRCSYFGPRGAETRIDHAIVTPPIDMVKAAYGAGVRRHRFGGSDAAYSDHAALEITCS